MIGKSLAVTVAVFGLLALPHPARATLEQCEALIETAPEAAVDFASDPDRVGGDANAKLCQADAAAELKEPEVAAELYRELAQHARNPAMAAALYRKSAWQFSLSKNYVQAHEMATQAIQLDPGNLDALYDRAAIFTQTEDFWSAKTDLDAVLSHIKPAKNAELAAKAYTLRAKVFQSLGQHDAALSDVEEALNLRPRDPDALLLRGNLRADKGDGVGAARDWQAVLKLAPGTDEADEAGHLLTVLDQNKSGE